ncbi:hypothetical protein B9Z55_023804 [Caenorhabditis nigoni]|uniref:Uncharacterized protein n=1 Tax=Caenorhabditis nigoni TaxID=1611254 RepID=A0A2G5SRL7_9PELO|nr:hypothetical protein B9Z55_023804 [Caenorhabditis nigoni]
MAEEKSKAVCFIEHQEKEKQQGESISVSCDFKSYTKIVCVCVCETSAREVRYKPNNLLFSGEKKVKFYAKK